MVDKSYQQKQKEVINYKGVNMEDSKVKRVFNLDKGTYQLCTTTDGENVYETLVNTSNGNVISRNCIKKIDYEDIHISH